MPTNRARGSPDDRRLPQLQSAPLFTGVSKPRTGRGAKRALEAHAPVARRASDASAAIAPRLLAWFDVHGRHDLPWQRERTPYTVWVSEVMLQQTQVATVVPFYERFIARFPTVEALAAAPLDDVLKLWSGLGYYARARTLWHAARAVVAQHGARVPDTFDELHALPGIGRSTAGAILAQARGARFPILDGNAKRVLARYHAVEGWPGDGAVQEELWLLAERHTPHERVADYTQAIMDLGATLCTRARPACTVCPLSDTCAACRAGTQATYPAPRPKRARPRRSPAPAGIPAGLRTRSPRRQRRGSGRRRAPGSSAGTAGPGRGCA